MRQPKYPGISGIISQLSGNIHLTASACNALVQFSLQATSGNLRASVRPGSSTSFVYSAVTRRCYTPRMKSHSRHLRNLFFLLLSSLASSLLAQDASRVTQLPNGKLLAAAPGNPRQTNNLPTTVALSHDGRFAVR